MRWSTLSQYEFNASESTFVHAILDVIFTLGVSTAVIIQLQAALCTQTSMERNTCCKRCCCTLKEDQHYAVIDGKDRYQHMQEKIREAGDEASMEVA